MPGDKKWALRDSNQLVRTLGKRHSLQFLAPWLALLAPMTTCGRLLKPGRC